MFGQLSPQEMFDLFILFNQNSDYQCSIFKAAATDGQTQNIYEDEDNLMDDELKENEDDIHI